MGTGAADYTAPTTALGTVKQAEEIETASTALYISMPDDANDVE